MSWADNSVKIDEICPLAIQNQIFTISMHISNLMKIHCDLLKLLSWNENTDVLQADNLKIDKIYHLAIPNQISTISMHIPSFMKIHWH